MSLDTGNPFSKWEKTFAAGATPELLKHVIPEVAQSMDAQCVLRKSRSEDESLRYSIQQKERSEMDVTVTRRHGSFEVHCQGRDSDNSKDLGTTFRQVYLKVLSKWNGDWKSEESDESDGTAREESTTSERGCTDCLSGWLESEQGKQASKLGWRGRSQRAW